MSTPDRFRAVRKDGTPVDLDNLGGGISETELAAAVAPKADQADVDAALASVVSGGGAARVFAGPEASVRPLIDALPDGTEYSWTKTNGAGVLLDLVSGVA